MTFPAPRAQWMASYAFSLPTEPALGAIAETSPHGVVEVGAGTGYWARLLHDRGVDVVAYDVAPPPSADNPWFAGVMPWYPVRVGDETVVDRHTRRTLLLVWPTRNEDWGAAAVARFAAAGGQHLAFVGETVGGRTGDDRLHALLGEVDRCWTCAYGIQTSACLCGIRPCGAAPGWSRCPMTATTSCASIAVTTSCASIAVTTRRHPSVPRRRGPPAPGCGAWAGASVERRHRAVPIRPRRLSTCSLRSHRERNGEEKSGRPRAR